MRSAIRPAVFSGIAVCVALLFFWGVAAAPQAPNAVPKAGDPVEAYHPDDVRPEPRPDRPRPSRTLEGYDTIVLGDARSDAQIVLTVAGRQPKIALESRRSGERIVCYLTSAGQAVLGVTTRDREQVGAGIYVERGMGKMILCDRDGVHVFDGAELERWSGRTGNVGAMPKTKP